MCMSRPRPPNCCRRPGWLTCFPVSGTDLLYISNTDNAIFYYLDDGSYYVLISGRWFKSRVVVWSVGLCGARPTSR